MDYRKLYNQIIDRARHRNITGYTERHHIIPRSLGGSDDADNLVDLTAREHFICHYLLAKMYKANTYNWHKMNHAFMMMKSSSKPQNRYINSRLYEALRENFSEVMSTAQSANNNSQFGSCWVYRLDTEQSKKIKKEELDDYLTQGWQKGRVIDFSIYNDVTVITKRNEEKNALRELWNKEKNARKKLKTKKQILKESRLLKQKLKDNNRRQYAYKLYKSFEDSECSSIREYCKKGYYDKSHVSLIKLWKRHIIEFKPVPNKPYTPV
jgi:hypothetical protein